MAAIDKEITFKVSVDPFEEMDKKKSALMYVKEVGLKAPKRVDYAAKFKPTTSKWDKNKLMAQTRAVFRYDLSLFASQVWQDFVPIQKAKNGQDKLKATNAFLKAVPKLQKNMEKNLKQKLEEFQEDIASGAGDDLGALKSTRKSLSAGHPEAMLKLIGGFFDEFEKSYNKLEKLKKTVQKSSGDQKQEATEAFESEIGTQLPELVKKLVGVNGILKKRLTVISGVPDAMKKNLKKDMSDAAKAEFTTSMAVLAKSASSVDTQITKFGKSAAEVLQKIKRKDIGSSTYNQLVEADSNLGGALGTLEDVMQKVDAKLKKLEQAVKKR